MIRILIVDDDAVWAHGLMSILTESGASVEIEAIPSCALQHALRFEPHLIVVDSLFENSSYTCGVEVANRLQQQDALSSAEVVITDNYEMHFHTPGANHQRVMKKSDGGSGVIDFVKNVVVPKTEAQTV